MSESNGHAETGGSLTYEQICEQTRLARAVTRLYRARAEARLLENVSGIGVGWSLGLGWSDLLDPYQSRYDPFHQLWLPIAGGGLHSRQQGRDRPFLWTDIDLDRIRSLARWLAAKNDIAIGALNTLRNFTIKKGYKWEAKPAPEYEDNATVRRLARAVQKVIDEYSDLNRLPSRERSSLVRAVRDGEVFTRHFAQDDGTTVVRPIEPEQIREAPGHSHDTFGVITDPDDVEDVQGYHITYDGSTYDQVSAANVCHLKRNTDECVKRGLSDFYSSGDSLDGVFKLLRALRAGGAAQASIAWIEQFKNVTASQASDYIAGIRDRNRATVQDPVSGRDMEFQKTHPATVLRVSEGREYMAPPLASNTSNHISIVQACLRSIGTRWNMPEYMISGDSSSSNYASTLVAGSPFVNAVECEQEDFGQFFLRWRWIAVRNAQRAGRFGDYTFEEIQQLIDIHYTPPQVAIANEGEMASVDHQDIAAGVLSLQTRAERRGLDWEKEQKRMKEKPPTRLPGKFTDVDQQGNPVESAPGPDIDGEGQGPLARKGIYEDTRHRNIGEVWQSEHGHWFTRNHQGHVVPARAPGGTTAATGPVQPPAPVESPVPVHQAGEKIYQQAIAEQGGEQAVRRSLIGRIGQTVWDTMDPDDQRIFSAMWATAKWLEHKAMLGFTKGRDLVKQTAKERGFSEAQVDRATRIVSVADQALAWTTTFPVVTLLTGNPAAGKVASFLPVASLAYLAWSTARDPFAVMRAAKKVITGAATTVHESLNQEAIAALLAGLEAASDPDWYMACVLTAMDHNDYDLHDAVLKADAAGPMPLGESLESLAEDVQHRRKGEVWQGQKGGWYTVNPQGHVVPTKAPDSRAQEPAPVATVADQPVEQPTPVEDVAKGRPSKPEERTRDENGNPIDARPPAKEWQDPPAKKVRAEGEKFVRPKGDDSQTKRGDEAEAAAIKLGFRSILPEGQRSHKPGEVAEKGSTIDLEFDHSGRAYELKMCQTTATEYRLKAKAKEKEAKYKYAELNNLTPHVLVGIRDVDTGEIHFYAGREPGLIGAEVNGKAYDYVGSVKL